MFPVILGTAKFGTFNDREQSYSVLDRFIELGGERLDTANNYACWHPDGEGGESETLLGEWLKTKQRESLHIITKIGARSVDGFTYDRLDGLSRNNIRQSVDDCLNRLQTHYIDTLYAHVDDPNTPLLETWKEMSALVEEGTVKHLGISNYTEARMLELVDVIQEHGLVPFDQAQYRYSLITPNSDADFGPQIVMNEHLFGALKGLPFKPEVIGYSPLMDGCFEHSPDELPEAYDNLINCIVMEDLQSEAKELGVSTSALVLKRISDYGITPITATSTPDLLNSNLKPFFS
ncbi:aldo/keto reductase [Enterovibrio sp. ZSDZ35]|uniref:Aldo/keto reductase n=1 Tax=Enterovibrio qingdaonensis TaxID=2899818 RepID=A0ABT5QJ29_9GAMM|nr:aldo/keto reductase [Enterovibrio sp. ZSDZ35]MDD1780629.1 aldo/keto reductase [Enterovibrio sp. ZSDZ35]